MAGRSPYFGDPEQAARLRAARTAAGFATARQAAARFGWQEPQYVSHEGARRGFDDAQEEYATAFGVSQHWLMTGLPTTPRDRKIEVSQATIDSLRRRVFRQASLGNAETTARGRRLRVARRLAGHRSVAAGAAAAEVHRTTLHAQENGRMGFDISGARRYAASFGCEPEWLMNGRLPSGYPQSITSVLDRLIADFALTEAEAAARIPEFLDRETVRDLGPISPLRSTSTPTGTSIIDVQVRDLVELLRQSSAMPRSVASGWSVPRTFLQRSLGGSPEHCVLLTVPVRYRAGSLKVRAGDRLIVDTSVRVPFAATYAVAQDADILAILDGSRESERELIIAAAEQRHNLVLLGQILSLISVI